MVDTLETAAAYGLSVNPTLSKGSAQLSADINFDPHSASMDRLVEAWLPLTFAMNSINRSMGLQDLYPFVLSPAVIVKINFVHACVHSQESWRSTNDTSGALKAIVAGLKAGLPTQIDQPNSLNARMRGQERLSPIFVANHVTKICDPRHGRACPGHPRLGNQERRGCPAQGRA
jgi:hypothetical protein